MKMAISGKGGYNVLSVDAEPDANLAVAIGVPSELRTKIKPSGHGGRHSAYGTVAECQ